MPTEPTTPDDPTLGILSTQGNHKRTTEAANQGVLESWQLDLVNDEHSSQDSVLNQTRSKYHFDNCAFELGAEYVEEQWATIEEHGLLDDESLSAFGRILHAVQDFYSHSNWIELYLEEEPIPLWDLQFDSLPQDIVSGTWIVGRPKLCSDYAPSHDDLNKDRATSEQGKKIVSAGPNKNKTYFDLVSHTAIGASREQFRRLGALNLPVVPRQDSKESGGYY